MFRCCVSSRIPAPAQWMGSRQPFNYWMLSSQSFSQRVSCSTVGVDATLSSDFRVCCGSLLATTTMLSLLRVKSDMHLWWWSFRASWQSGYKCGNFLHEVWESKRTTDRVVPATFEQISSIGARELSAGPNAETRNLRLGDTCKCRVAVLLPVLDNYTASGGGCTEQLKLHYYGHVTLFTRSVLQRSTSRCLVAIP